MRGPGRSRQGQRKTTTLCMRLRDIWCSAGAVIDILVLRVAFRYASELSIGSLANHEGVHVATDSISDTDIRVRRTTGRGMGRGMAASCMRNACSWS